MEPGLHESYLELTVWNPADGTLARRIQNIAERTYAIDLSPDGDATAVASGSPGRIGEVRLFQAGSGELLKVVGTAADVVLDVVYSPDGQLLVVGADGTVRAFVVVSAEERLAITSHSDWVLSTACHPASRRLAAGCFDGSVRVWDINNGRLIVEFVAAPGQS